MWMDTAMHVMGSLGHTRLGEPNPVPGHVEGGGQPVQLRAVFYFISSLPFLLAFAAGGLGFACSSPAGGMLFRVSGRLPVLLLLIHG